MVTALLALALAVSGFVVTDWFPVAVVSIALLGAAGVIGGTGTQTLMQHVVDGAMRGRVMSLYGLIHRGGPAVGAAECQPVIECESPFANVRVATPGR